MTDQIQSGMLAMMQVMAAQNQVPQIGTKKAGEDQADFQKMLEQKSQPAKEEAKPQQPEQARQPEEAPEQPTQAGQAEGQPEDGHAMVKRLAEAGMIPVDAANAYLMQAQQPVQAQQPETELQAVPVGQEGQLLTPEFRQLDQAAVVQQPEEAVPQQQAQPEQVFQAEPQAEQPMEAARQNPAPEAPVEREAPVQARQAPVEQAEPRQEEQDGVEQMDVSQGAQPLFRDVEAAPIKVGEAYQPEQSQQADVSQQIAGPLNQALATGQSKVEIHLNPEYLGSVKVEITQSAEGILRVALTAESSETRGLLEKHAANLQTLLGREQQTVEVEVQRQQNDSQQPQDNPYQDGHNGQNRQQPRQHRQQKGDEQDFLQKLRLGLAPVEARQ